MQPLGPLSGVMSMHLGCTVPVMQQLVVDVLPALQQGIPVLTSLTSASSSCSGQAAYFC